MCYLVSLLEFTFAGLVDREEDTITRREGDNGLVTLAENENVTQTVIEGERERVEKDRKGKK